MLACSAQFAFAQLVHHLRFIVLRFFVCSYRASFSLSSSSLHFVSLLHLFGLGSCCLVHVVFTYRVCIVRCHPHLSCVLLCSCCCSTSSRWGLLLALCFSVRVALGCLGASFGWRPALARSLRHLACLWSSSRFRHLDFDLAAYADWPERHATIGRDFAF